MHRHALFFLAVVAPFAAEAAAPPLIPVTGYLTDDAGAPVNASVDLTLALYPDATSASPAWAENQTVAVDNGQFTAYLGAQNPLALDQFRDNGTWYLGMAVGTGAEMSPRFQVATAPFAAYAQYCDDAATVGGIDPADLRLATDPVDWAAITPSTIPAGLADGDNDTTYTAGAGLTLTATTFAADQATIEGWAKGVAYDTQGELRAQLDGVYAAKQACTANQVLAADSTGAWVCTDSTALPISETAVDNAVANNGYALASDLTSTATALTALTGRVATAEGTVAAAQTDITALKTSVTALQTQALGDHAQADAARPICYAGLLSVAGTGAATYPMIILKYNSASNPNAQCQTQINPGWHSCGVAKAHYQGQDCGSSAIDNLDYGLGYTDFERTTPFNANKAAYPGCTASSAAVCCSPMCNGT